MSMISEQVRRLREFAKTLKYADEYNLVNGAADTIEELSAKLHKSQMERTSQYYNGGWIPVSERLPEEAGMYLCSYDDDYVGTSYFDIRMNEFNMLHEQVTAWMSIPEPYKAKTETWNGYHGQVTAPSGYGKSKGE